MQSLTTQLSAIERHEKQLEKLKSNNKHTTCQIQDLLETEYSAMVFAQVSNSLILIHFDFLLTSPIKARLLQLKPHPFICMRNFINRKVGNRKN